MGTKYSLWRRPGAISLVMPCSEKRKWSLGSSKGELMIGLAITTRLISIVSKLERWQIRLVLIKARRTDSTAGGLLSTPIVAIRLPYKGRIVKPVGGASPPQCSHVANCPTACSAQTIVASYGEIECLNWIV